MTDASPGVLAAEQIEAMMDDLAVQLAAAPEEHFTRRATPEDWTAAEVIGHLVEMLPYWARVARDVAATPGSPIGRALDDPDRTGAIAGANTLPRAEALARLRAAAHEAATVLRPLNAADWDVTGMHHVRGVLAVGDLVESLLTRHAEEHVRQALQAAGRSSTDGG